MIKKIIGTVISVSISFGLLLGSESLHQFAFYVMSGMTGIAWLCLFCGAVKGEAAAEIRSRLWISVPSSAFSLYSMIATGHAILAAASFMATFFILTLAFRKPEIAA